MSIKAGLKRCALLGLTVETDGQKVFTMYVKMVDQAALTWVKDNEAGIIDHLLGEAREPEEFHLSKSLMGDPIEAADLAVERGASELETVAILQHYNGVMNWGMHNVLMGHFAHAAVHAAVILKLQAQGIYPPSLRAVADNLARLGADQEQIIAAMTADSLRWDMRAHDSALERVATGAIMEARGYREDYTWLTSAGTPVALWEAEPRIAEGEMKGYAAHVNVFRLITEQPPYLRAGFEVIDQRRLQEAQDYITGKRAPRKGPRP